MTPPIRRSALGLHWAISRDGQFEKPTEAPYINLFPSILSCSPFALKAGPGRGRQLKDFVQHFRAAILDVATSSFLKFYRPTDWLGGASSVKGGGTWVLPPHLDDYFLHFYSFKIWWNKWPSFIILRGDFSFFFFLKRKSYWADHHCLISPLGAGTKCKKWQGKSNGPPALCLLLNTKKISSSF